MALLSQTMRNAAFTGSTDSVFTRVAGRQGARWAEQTVGAACPATRSQRGGTPSARPARVSADRATTLRDLQDLRERDVITDGELERLRARLQL